VSIGGGGMGLAQTERRVVRDGESLYGGFYVSEVSALATVVIDGTVC
jgi:hypothetical protein